MVKSERVDGVSPAAQNMAIETFLGLMVFLLVMLLVAIVLAPAMTGSMAASGPAQGSDLAPLGWSADGPEGLRDSEPRQDTPAAAGSAAGTGIHARAAQPGDAHPGAAHPGATQARRGRYKARHVRGYVPPPQRVQGPPWDEAKTQPESGDIRAE